MAASMSVCGVRMRTRFGRDDGGGHLDERDADVLRVEAGQIEAAPRTAAARHLAHADGDVGRMLGEDVRRVRLLVARQAVAGRLDGVRDVEIAQAEHIERGSREMNGTTPAASIASVASGGAVAFKYSPSAVRPVTTRMCVLPTRCFRKVFGGRSGTKSQSAINATESAARGEAARPDCHADCVSSPQGDGCRHGTRASDRTARDREHHDEREDMEEEARPDEVATDEDDVADECRREQRDIARGAVRIAGGREEDSRNGDDDRARLQMREAIEDVVDAPPHLLRRRADFVIKGVGQWLTVVGEPPGFVNPAITRNGQREGEYIARGADRCITSHALAARLRERRATIRREP